MITTLCILASTLLVLNFPMFILLVMTSILIIMAYTSIPLTILATQMFGSIDKFALMAVPFFIFGANVMAAGGLSKRLVAWVEALIGWLRGGIALTTIASCEFFGAISGSSPATVVAIGSILYPPLVKHGYGEKFSLGLVTSIGGVASIIPPSIAMIMYCAITGASVGALFLAGVIPGILFGACIAIWVVIHTYRADVPIVGTRDVAAMLRATKAAAWAVGTPVLILGGIYSGIFTPTEAAAVSAVYAIVVSLFVYREITVAQLFRIAVESGLVTAKIMIIIAASGVIAWILTVGGAPAAISAWVQEAGASRFAVLLLINVVLLLAGMFVDPNSSLIVLTPLFYPIVTALGIDPIHFGIIVIMNLAIGMYTPPFGLNLFVSSSIFRAPLRKIVPGLVPFILASLVALLITTYVPEVSLWLPRLVYPSSIQ